MPPIAISGIKPPQAISESRETKAQGGHVCPFRTGCDLRRFAEKGRGDLHPRQMGIVDAPAASNILHAQMAGSGLDGLHFHDIQGTTCTMLADAGSTPSEIASMLGCTVAIVTEMLDRYQSMIAAQSDSAVMKLEASQGQKEAGGKRGRGENLGAEWIAERC